MTCTRSLRTLPLALALSASTVFAQAPAAPTAKPAPPTAAEANLNAMKRGVSEHVDEMAKLAQEMVDSVFSFGELGFQEVETSKYLTGAAREERLHGHARRRRHSHRLGGHLGIAASR